VVTRDIAGEAPGYKELRKSGRSAIAKAYLMRAVAAAARSYQAAWPAGQMVIDFGAFFCAALLGAAVGRGNLWPLATAAAAIWLIIFWSLGMYGRVLQFDIRDEFYALLAVVLIGAPFQVVAGIALRYSSVPLKLVAFATLWTLVLTCAVRLLTWRLRPTSCKELGLCAFPPAMAQQATGLSMLREGVKRCFDFALALPLLAVCFPVVCVAGLAVFIESGWPVLFTQERIGKDGRPFQIIKLRTMVTNADERWAVPGDQRVTRVGRFLRRFSIDELTQLLNVLRGEMSLVGPRPELPSYERQFCDRVPLYSVRRLVKPGMTGLAQVKLPRTLTTSSMPMVALYDYLYVTHWSLLLDLSIVTRTTFEFPFHRVV
jgi:lipopolysaccharide/colanic/teichoic acid biosynthesis glycosyltransferase